MTLSLDGDIGARQAGRSGEVSPILGPRPPGSSCPTMVTTVCGPHQFDQSNRLLPWLTPSCAMAGAPSTRNGRPSGSTRLSRRMWPSTAHLRPVLSVTIGAITTVVFWPCATSRIRSWGGSQCADLDAEADGGVDLGTLVRLGVGFRQSSTCTDYCRYAPMILCCCTRPGGKRAVSRCVNTEQGPELIIAVCGEDPETTAPTDAAPRVPWPRSRRLVERMHRPGRWIDRDHARRIRSTQRGHQVFGGGNPVLGGREEPLPGLVVSGL